MVACPVCTAATSGALPAWRRQPCGARKATPACGYLTTTVPPLVGIAPASGGVFLSDPQPAKANTGRVNSRARRISAPILIGFERQAAPGDGRGLHDRRGRLPERGEPVDELLEVRDVADVGLQEEAVLAGDAVALDDLGRRVRDLGDLGQLPRCGAHADHRGERVAEGA